MIAKTVDTVQTQYDGWKAGCARRCITPEKPIWLYGYAGRPRFQPSRGVLSDLYADAVVLQTGDNKPAIVVTLDLCVLRKPLAEALISRIEQATGIERERIIVNVSHTHSGPALDQEDLAGRMPMNEAERAVVTEYTHWMQAQVAAVAAAAFADLKPSVLRYGFGKTDIMKNRRNLDDTGQWQKMRANPEGPVDPRVPVLRIDDTNDRPRVVLFGCACHNVTLDQNNLLISADYAGFARTAIERTLPECQATFITGCGADANTEPRGGDRQAEFAVEHGETLAKDVLQVVDGDLEPVSPTLDCADCAIELPLQAFLDRADLEKRAESKPEWKNMNARRMLNTLHNDEPLPESYTTYISCWQLGDTVTFLGLPGEVVSEYALRIGDELGSRRIWVAGYSNEVFGYLPSRQILQEGGYETRGLMPPALGYFAPEVEEVVVASAVTLARQLQRVRASATRS